MQTIILNEPYFIIFGSTLIISIILFFISLYFIAKGFNWFMLLYISICLIGTSIVGFLNSYTDTNYEIFRKKIMTEVIRTRTFKILILNPISGDYEVFETQSKNNIDNVYLDKFYSRSGKFLNSKITLLNE